jgi:hypothetical protein
MNFEAESYKLMCRMQWAHMEEVLREAAELVAEITDDERRESLKNKLLKLLEEAKEGQR